MIEFGSMWKCDETEFSCLVQSVNFVQFLDVVSCFAFSLLIGFFLGVFPRIFDFYFITMR